MSPILDMGHTGCGANRDGENQAELSSVTPPLYDLLLSHLAGPT